MCKQLLLLYSSTKAANTLGEITPMNYKLFSAATFSAAAALLAGCESTPNTAAAAPTTTTGALAKPTAAVPAAASGPNISCLLVRSGEQYQGTCGIPCEAHNLAVNFDGIKRGFTCSEPVRQVPASLRATAKSSQWLGEMQGRQPEDPTRFEVITTGTGGVAKLPYGWFALQNIREQGGGMELNIASGKQLPPTTDDVKIINRATQLLASNAVWNKNDDRNCPPINKSSACFVR
jgi:hypothetical protein